MGKVLENRKIIAVISRYVIVLFSIFNDSGQLNYYILQPFGFDMPNHEFQVAWFCLDKYGPLYINLHPSKQLSSLWYSHLESLMCKVPYNA